MRLLIKDYESAFDNAHRALLKIINPEAPDWEGILESVAREEAAWIEKYNAKIISIDYRREEVEFETAAEATAFY